MIDKQILETVGLFEGLVWRKTVFEDVEVYYAEERTYIVKINRRQEENGVAFKPVQYRIVKAASEDAAIAFACFDLAVKRRDVPKTQTDGASREELVALCERLQEECNALKDERDGADIRMKEWRKRAEEARQHLREAADIERVRFNCDEQNCTICKNSFCHVAKWRGALEN